MTQALPSTVNPNKKFSLGAAIGGPVSLWATVTKDGGELSWVLAGKFALMSGNAVVMLFLANRLELQTYGLLVITISCQLLISRLLMMGVDSGMVRLTTVPELRSRDKEVVTAGLVSMACTSGALLVLALLAVPVLSPLGIPGWAIACIVAGSIGTALVDYGYSFCLAQHRYPLAALSQGGTALLRLGITIATVTFGAPPVAVFIAYHGASLFSGLMQASFIASASWRRPDRSLILQLLRYSFWLGKASVIVIFSLYQGTFLLTLLKQPAATAVFGLGLSLSLGVFAVFNAYTEYLSVRVRSVEHIKDLPRFIRRAMGVALVLILACVPVVFVVEKLMPWLLGPEWLEVVPIFAYLSVAMALLILEAPLVAASHYLLKPQLITFAWVTHAVLIAITGLILAPQMGALGAAVAQVVGSALALIVLSYLVAGALRSATRVGS
jgi:O-antigen/teichoic acid export membrane protein